jgi:hypothetical protein
MFSVEFAPQLPIGLRDDRYARGLNAGRLSVLQASDAPRN